MGTAKKEAARKVRQAKVGDGMNNVKTKGENFYRYIITCVVQYWESKSNCRLPDRRRKPKNSTYSREATLKEMLLEKLQRQLHSSLANCQKLVWSRTVNGLEIPVLSPKMLFNHSEMRWRKEHRIPTKCC